MPITADQSRWVHCRFPALARRDRTCEGVGRRLVAPSVAYSCVASGYVGKREVAKSLDCRVHVVRLDVDRVDAPASSIGSHRYQEPDAAVAAAPSEF